MYLRPASISVRSKGRLNTNTILWEYGLGGGYEGEIKTVRMVINTVPQVICLVTCPWWYMCMNRSEWGQKRLKKIMLNEMQWELWFFKGWNMKISLFWDVMLGRMVAGGQCFYKTPQQHIHSASVNTAVISISLEQVQYRNRDSLLHTNYNIFSSNWLAH